MADVPEVLAGLINEVLEYVVDDVIPSGEPLQVIALTVTASDVRKLDRITAETYADAPRIARQTVASRSGSCAYGLIAWSDAVTIAGMWSEAILVEGAGAGGDESYVVAQRFGRRGIRRKTAYLIGTPILVRRGDALLAD